MCVCIFVKMHIFERDQKWYMHHLSSHDATLRTGALLCSTLHIAPLLNLSMFTCHPSLHLLKHALVLKTRKSCAQEIHS